MDMKQLELQELNGHAKNQNGRSIAEPSYFHESLEHIKRYLEKENEVKQRTIERQLRDIDLLKADIDSRQAVITGLQHQLDKCSQHAEGNRQLINKLLNDISRYQSDIEWYKKTYEKRSLWGILKEKLLTRR